jgi:phospholipase/carboxylesterase
MLHGRGEDASGMLGLAEVLAQPDITYLAPEATGRSWCPYSFLAPIARNEPFLSSALELIDRLLDGVSSQGIQAGARRAARIFSRGLPRPRIRGAARAPSWRLVGLSGGLIGPEGTPRDYAGRAEVLSVQNRRSL